MVAKNIPKRLDQIVSAARHDRCWDCEIRQRDSIRFAADAEGKEGSYIGIDYCRCLGAVLTPEIRNIAYLLDCKYRSQKP